MTILYTMTVRTKKISRDVDPTTGQVVETNDFREHKMTGLPSQTVANWRRDFPDSVVSAVQEDPRPDYRGNRKPYVAPATKPVTRTEPRQEPKSIKSAPSQYGDNGYADAINKKLKEEMSNAA